MMTLEEALIAHSLTPGEAYKCERCHRPNAPFAMTVDSADSVVVTTETVTTTGTADVPGETPPTIQQDVQVVTVTDALCTNCKIDEERAAIAVQEAAVDQDAWDQRGGDAVRSKRNILLNSYAWTVTAGTPLTPACEAEFAEYLLALNRLTKEFAKPSDVIWPTTPDMAYSLALDEMTTDQLNVFYHQKIDFEAGEFRKNFITSVPGQEAIYRIKQIEAETWAEGADPAGFPYLSAEANVRGISLADMVAMILQIAAQWTAISVAIEAQRIGAKEAVTAAATPADKQTAANVDWAALVPA